MRWMTKNEYNGRITITQQPLLLHQEADEFRAHTNCRVDLGALHCCFAFIYRWEAKNRYPIPISDRRDNGESLNKENRQWNRFDRYSCVIDHVQGNHNIKIQNADGECEAENWYVRVGNSMVLLHGAGTFDMQMNSVNVQLGACLQCIVIYGLWVLSSDS